MKLRIKILSTNRLYRFHRRLSNWRWIGFRDAVVELQLALPDSDDYRVKEIREYLHRVRSATEDLMYG